jgi:hypothetical protein
LLASKQYARLLSLSIRCDRGDRMQTWMKPMMR